jgi:hypothetical protein
MTDSPLTPEELASLREIAKGPRATQIPFEHTEKLLKLGLITQIRLVYFLTEEGKWRLERG